MADLIIEARGLRRDFPHGQTLLGRPSGATKAVDGVDLRLSRGETLGIVGESGSGKSTLGRLIARLDTPTAGSIEIDGRDIARAKGRELRALRRTMQVVFQDPYGSLDPTKTVADAVAEPLLVHKLAKRREAQKRAEELLALVSLDPAMGRRYPRELSGGQRQRAAIARAMALGPEILIADEPTSALDLSTRSGILNLLLDLQREAGLGIVLISHDFATVRHMAHRVMVMYLGRIVEEADMASLSERQLHPYAEALLSSVPVPDPVVQRQRQRIVLGGDLPNPSDPPSGCRFRLRCPYVAAVCATKEPQLVEVEPGRRVACHRHGDREYAAEVAAGAILAPSVV